MGETRAGGAAQAHGHAPPLAGLRGAGLHQHREEALSIGQGPGHLYPGTLGSWDEAKAAPAQVLGAAPLLLSTRSLEDSSAASPTSLKHLPSLLHLQLCFVGQSLAWAKSRSGDMKYSTKC